MIIRIITVILALTAVAKSQSRSTTQVVKGDPIAKVYHQFGSPTLEYPLNGKFILEYDHCTIICSNSTVLSSSYHPGHKAPVNHTQNNTPPTIKEIKSRALQGDAEAQYLLAYCLQFGKAVDQSHEKAIDWYKKSAMQGHMPAQHNLGYLYMQGKGVEQDYTQAYIWALLAAENGNDILKQALVYKLSQEQKHTGEMKAKQIKEQIRRQKADLQEQAR